MVWEAVFLLLVLKIPVVYLCWVVWWAIKAEPRPYEGAPIAAPLDPEPQSGGGRYWRPRLAGGPRRGPHGGPHRTYARRSTPVFARGRAR